MVWWAWLAITAITFLVLLVWSPRALSPKRLVVKLLDGYRRVNAFRQWLRGTTATEEVERRVISGQAWADFCDTLKAAGAAINAAGTPMDAYTQAEGYRCVPEGWIVVCAARCTADRRSGGAPRYLSRLVRGGLEQFVENSDTEAPRFLTMVDGHRNSPVKLGLDNPSNVYSTARVRGTADYVVRGHRGTVAILSFGYQVCGLWRYATTRLCVADSMCVWLCVLV